jgi:uracil-DNA glycosylase family 4
LSGGPDSPRDVAADLQRWVQQQEGRLPDWFLDEGAPEMPAATEAPVPAQATTSVRSGDVAPAASASPARKSLPAAPEMDAAFQSVCDQFVGDTLALIRRYAGGAAAGLEPDPLLAAHGGDRAAALAELRAAVLPCTACALHERRTNTVFGEGSPAAEIVFVGEAPGQDEDLQGEPFVGKSGQLLTKILGAIGFAREDVYICNILKCRPPNNRDPLPEEVQCCEPHLKRQLAILQPKVICCLGRVAAQTLLGTDTSLKKLRSTVHFYAGVPVMATFHPAALLRNPSWKRDTWDDVRKLRALVDALRAGEA